MDSYLYSPTAKTALSCRGSINVAENFDSLNDGLFLDVTTSPVDPTKDHGKLQNPEISSHVVIEQENSQPLLEIYSEKNKIFDIVDDIPETPNTVAIIDLTTPKKTSQNRSPLLPTQPLLTNASAMQRRCRNGTLDSWIKWIEPSPKSEPINADKCALWLDISPDISPEKRSLVIKADERYTRNRKSSGKITSDSFASQSLLESLTNSTKIQPSFSSSGSGETRRLTSNTEYADENISKSLQISPQICVRSNKNHISESVTKLQDSSILLGLTLPLTSNSEEKTNENQLGVISSSSDDSCFPLTPSPPDSLRKSETLKQVSLATILNRSNMVRYCAVPNSQHTRSLIKAISSPTFRQNDRKYVSNELTSRFNDDGKVRRKKDERRLLHGFDCRCCTAYYEALGLNQDERSKRIDQVSKHRNTEKEPSTPEYYWEIRMPNREEQRRRGQILESNSPIALKTRYPQYKTKSRARRRLFV